jgi:hypothetical protein
LVSQPRISLPLQTDNELTIIFAVSGGQHAVTLLWPNIFLRWVKENRQHNYNSFFEQVTTKIATTSGLT